MGHSHIQTMEALASANKIRLGRASIKRQISRGRTLTIATLENPLLTNMAVTELLRAQRRWGEARARKCLAACGMSEFKTVGDMTKRQKRVITQYVRERNENGG